MHHHRVASLSWSRCSWTTDCIFPCFAVNGTSYNQRNLRNASEIMLPQSNRFAQLTSQHTNKLGLCR